MSTGSSTSSSQSVQVVPASPNSSQLWHPTQGLETSDLLSHLGLPPDAQLQLITEAIQILSRCVPPTSIPSDNTGLVTGYVQSGKTMSFTTVAALARDNGFHVVIVIAGTSIPLSIQSRDRLVKDLRLLSRTDRKWRHFHNPKPNPRTKTSMEDTLAEWDDNSVPDHERQTILITVMKNHTHLTRACFINMLGKRAVEAPNFSWGSGFFRARENSGSHPIAGFSPGGPKAIDFIALIIYETSSNLIQLLNSLHLTTVPALMIDDEADQAGLNNQVNNAQESTTYSRLLALRGSLSHHSFLQYTATPQAPLLINLIDALSPDFAEVLTPGQDYFGGYDFFIQHRQLVRTIPNADIPGPNNQLYSPPDSLIEAMQVFVLGVASGIIVNEGRGNRSMMVHPSQTTAPHSQYHHWVVQIIENWKQTLMLPDGTPDREDLLTEFQSAYAELLTTAPNLPPFPQLSDRLLHALRRTSIHEVNARRGTTPQIPWRDTYAHILVGGQAMDRGFTVEGLTVTYMPRGLGVGNADTVQQRARFFGYKRPYFGYCRVYLEPSVQAAYQVYVEHEEDVRERLAQHAKSGNPLSEWKRAFFLDSALRPTRNSVLQLPYMQSSISDDWYAPKVPHETEDAVRENRAVVAHFVSTCNWSNDSGHANRTTPQRHHVTQIPLRILYEDLLTKVRVVHPPDSQKYTGMLLQVSAYLAANPDANATIYHMSAGLSREREVNAENEVPQLFQGKNPRVGDVIYPGDRAIKSDAGLTVQIHNLRILKSIAGGQPEEIAANVPTLAVWVPADMAKDWLVQRRADVI